MHRYSYRNNLLGTEIMSTDIELICTGIGKICEGVGIMCTVLGKPLAQSCISNFSAGTNRGLTSQVPRPTFGSGSGLQCVYTVVISLWGTPAPKFVLEPPKTVFYWILLCIRKPQAKFQKFSSTHVSPSNRFISSPQLPLLVGTKDEEYLPIWTLYFSVHVSLHFFVDDLP